MPTTYFNVAALDAYQDSASRPCVWWHSVEHYSWGYSLCLRTLV